MISETSVLTREDWANLNGNDVYVQMLRNKVKVTIDKNTKINGTDVSLDNQLTDYLKISDDDSLLGTVLEYLKEVPEDLVYYDIEDVFGNKTVYVYFFNPLDKQNFIHYYNTVYSIDKVTK